MARTVVLDMVGAGFPAGRVVRQGVRWRGLALPDFVRVCGVAVVLGGILTVAAAVFAALLMSGFLHSIGPTGYEMFAERFRYVRLENLLFVMPGAAAATLVGAGIFGVGRFVEGCVGKRVLLVSAAAVAVGFGLFSVVLTVREFMPRYSMPNSLDISPLQVWHGVAVGGWVVAMTVAGVCAVRVRSLGGWRFVLPLLGVAGIPPERAFAFMDFPIGPTMMIDIGTSDALLVQGMRGLSGVVWVFVGVMLVGAREREQAMKSRDSLAVVKRFYREFWVLGDTDIADELLAPGFEDLRHGTTGAAAFRHVLEDLRTTFPDMEFTILEQTADGAEVTTKWQMIGTDTGGLLYFPPTGKRATFTGTFTEIVRDGKIIAHDGYVDEAALYAQLGLG